MLLTDQCQVLLGFVKGPVRHPVSAVLVTVGIPKHYFLESSAVLKVSLIYIVFKHVGHHPSAYLQIFNGLKKGNHINFTVDFAIFISPQPFFSGNKQYFQKITHLMSHADNNAPDGIGVTRDGAAYDFKRLKQL
jgi:hypothetical protein